jgi:peroxin-6
MDGFKLASDVSVAALAIQTAALVAIDIVDFLTQAEVIAVRESLYGWSLSS